MLDGFVGMTAVNEISQGALASKKVLLLHAARLEWSGQGLKRFTITMVKTQTLETSCLG